jgi:hypothetical protein
MQEYPKVLAAVASVETSRWNIVDAVVAEIERKPDGRAKPGEFARCARYLAQHGYRHWTFGHIRNMFQVGVWLDGHAWRVRFREFSVEAVREARQSARSNHDRALAKLDEFNGDKNAIRADKEANKPKKPEAAAGQEANATRVKAERVRQSREQPGIVTSIRIEVEKLIHDAENVRSRCRAADGNVTPEEWEQIVELVRGGKSRIDDMLTPIALGDIGQVLSANVTKTMASTGVRRAGGTRFDDLVDVDCEDDGQGVLVPAV